MSDINVSLKNKTVATKKWWQWLLMYPALFIAILGHIPNAVQLYRSYKQNIPFRDVDFSMQQNNMWAKNIQCVQGLTFHEVTTPMKDKISVGICDCGDVLVCFDPGNRIKKRTLKWLSFNEISDKTALIFFSQKAYADRLNNDNLIAGQGNPKVLCQKNIGNGKLLIRLRYPDGHCVDQTINTYTGAVISAVKSSCKSGC